MKDFVIYAIYPAVGVLIAALILWMVKSVAKLVIKNPWKAIWVGISLFYASWGIFSLLNSTVKFLKISEHATLHKVDAINIFSFLLGCNIIMFFITFSIFYLVMRKMLQKDSIQHEESTSRGETRRCPLTQKIVQHPSDKSDKSGGQV